MKQKIETRLWMQRELSALLARPVDLVSRSGLKPRIRESMLATSEELYAR